MEFKEFIELVEIAMDEIPEHSDYFYIERRNFKADDPAPMIVQKHTTGGAHGGNCWGDNAEYFSNNQSEDDFLPLDPILKATIPDISYLKYKEIEKLIEKSHDSDREYYGNFTEYNIYKLDIRKLYDKLFV